VALRGVTPQPLRAEPMPSPGVVHLHGVTPQPLKYEPMPAPGVLHLHGVPLTIGGRVLVGPGEIDMIGRMLTISQPVVLTGGLVEATFQAVPFLMATVEAHQ